MKEREDIPIMLLGLKRDLREEKAGVIYPQEVSCLFRIESGLAAVMAHRASLLTSVLLAGAQDSSGSPL